MDGNTAGVMRVIVWLHENIDIIVSDQEEFLCADVTFRLLKLGLM
jgi:hypothetical protein